MVDAVLIELEGVLFDTRALRQAARPDAPGEDSSDPVLADLAVMRAERAFSDALAARGAELIAGARDFVREASATARLVVVARARRGDASTLLRLGGIEEFFSIVITADDVVDGKRDAYHQALDRLARQRTVDTGAVLALEESAEGIRAAREAGIRCIAVGGVPAHVAMEADAYVESLSGHTMRSLDQLSRTGGGQEHVQ